MCSLCEISDGARGQSDLELFHVDHAKEPLNMDRDVESVCSLFVIADDAFGQSDLDGDSDRFFQDLSAPL